MTVETRRDAGGDASVAPPRTRAPAVTPRIGIGWREWIALPALGITALAAKIDTGARSSALHVDAHWTFVDGGAPWVGFRMSAGAPGEGAIEAQAPVLDTRCVTDSGGHRTERIFIRTPMQLAGVTREIDINLSDRRGMRFAMLLGRTAMARAFIVHPGRSFVQGRGPKAGD